MRHASQSVGACLPLSGLPIARAKRRKLPYETGWTFSFGSGQVRLEKLEMGMEGDWGSERMSGVVVAGYYCVSGWSR